MCSARSVLALVWIALLPGTASAWTPVGWVARCDQPLRWALARDEHGWAEGYEAAVKAAFEAWGPAEGHCYRFEYLGLVDAPAEPWIADGVWTVRFVGEEGPMPANGVLASMPRLSKGPRVEAAGLELFELVENDIVLVGSAPLVTAEQAASEGCEGAVVIENLLGYEIGRSLGMGESEAPTAAVHWPLEACSTRAAAPGPDEREGLDALYAGRSVPEVETAVLPGSETWLLLDQVRGAEAE